MQKENKQLQDDGFLQEGKNTNILAKFGCIKASSCINLLLFIASYKPVAIIDTSLQEDKYIEMLLTDNKMQVMLLPLVI